MGEMARHKKEKKELVRVWFSPAGSDSIIYDFFFLFLFILPALLRHGASRSLGCLLSSHSLFPVILSQLEKEVQQVKVVNCSASQLRCNLSTLTVNKKKKSNESN